MKLLPLSIAAVAFALAACGGGESTPDAEPPIDATVDATPPPDAFVCGPAPMMQCGPVEPDDCVDTSSNEQHCTDCDMPCQGGATCNDGCECVAAFLNATHAMTGFDQFQTLGTIVLALGPEASASGINALGVGYDTTMQMTGVEYTLSSASPGTPPFVLAAYDVDISNMQAEAGFYAESGTIEFTTMCATGVSGTITDAVFRGATLGLPPTIDPDGCTFAIPQIDFVIGAACP
jgi:hypothetical protein